MECQHLLNACNKFTNPYVLKTAIPHELECSGNYN